MSMMADFTPSLKKGEYALRLRNVSKSFGNVTAVHSLSARIPAGCIYGFLGPNGAGKTTTLRMIMDVFRPDFGEIRVLGQSAARQAKDRVGYLPEERGLYPDMTVQGVLTYIGQLKGLSARDAKEAGMEWLNELDLSGWADREVQDLSRGMEHRVEFAAAVLHSPELVILDEPFSGLDPVNLDLMRGLIAGLRQQGRTVLLSTHMMERAEDLCDYILLINQGRKVLDGTLDEVRSTEGPPRVEVEIEGNDEFVESLPMVSAVTRESSRLEIRLADHADSQSLLRALVEKSRVRLFRLKSPSLHEVFLRAVQTVSE